MAKVLIVEDNRDLCYMISDSLTAEHYEVEEVYDGNDGLDRLNHYAYDAVVLDWELPGLSGIEICKRVRDRGKNIPILMLTGKNAITEKELGLDAGADDYLTKPFHMTELRARLRALLRRSSGSTSTALKVREIELNPTTRQVTKCGAELELLPKEFALLEFLMRHPNQVFTTDSLLNHVWRSDVEATPEALRTCLMRLRKKIDVGDKSSIIRTVHGVGYKLQG